MLKNPFRILAFLCTLMLCAGQVLGQIDTSYISIAPKSVLNKLVLGKPPIFTFQLSGYYNIGLLDLAANDNTVFRKEDFEKGRNFGTRYGYGVSLTGKISLHKAGNARLTITPAFQRFQSDFVISESPFGRVALNVFSGAIGIENNFTPFRPFKPYVGFEIIGSSVSGEAVFKTDTADFNLDIKSSFRIGASVNVGFEYAFNDKVGVNFGMRLTHVNTLLRKSKTSTNPNETYLNDEYVNIEPRIPYSGWKQFYYASIYGGFNFYIGMKNRK